MARLPLVHLSMSQLTRLLGALLCVLGVALLALLAPAPAQAAGVEAVRTIANTAQIEWDESGQHLQLASNEVDIAVDLHDFTLTAFHFGSGTGSVELTAPAPLCAGSAGAVPVALSAAWQSEQLSPATVVATKMVHAGEPLFFVLDYPAGNLDPTRPDTVTGVILTKSGDRETLTVTETGPNTGTFVGYIQTVAGPSPPGDCRLGVVPGDSILVESEKSGTQTPFITVELGVLFDPNGIVFDSSDGSPISGAKITLVDAATGAPAQVYGDDGNAQFPATLVSGGTATDSEGVSYQNGAGAYRYPLVRPGRYKVVVQPPPGYHAPSVRSAAQLATLIAPDGTHYQVVDASYGAAFDISGPAAVRVEIPLDKIGQPIQVIKSADRTEASPGDTIAYAIGVRNPDPKVGTAPIIVTDHFPRAMRLRAGTLRVNSHPAPVRMAADGRSFDVDVPALAPGASATITYGMEVLGTAAEGDTVNQADGHDGKGTTSNTGDAVVRIRRDAIADRVTIEGRVTDGGCPSTSLGTGGKPGPSTSLGTGRGLPGVRIMLEDGSYAVTDPDGRYHFEGVTAGTHVVQMDDTTLPADRAAVDCSPDTRSGGRAFSRFVDGHGGDLKRVDFHAVAAPPRAPRRAAAETRPKPASDAEAAGAARDWIQGLQPGIAWLFPAPDHNPRAPIVRVAIEHLAGQKVALFSGGKPVAAIAYDGEAKSVDGKFAVSVWRGIPLETGATELSAEVRNEDGSIAQTLHRTVHYGGSPMQAELLRDRSVLVADGVTRPVIAVRLTDRDGRPVRHGLVGDFQVPEPYYPAVEADAQQARQLAGLERAKPVWRVAGDDGIAYIELEPTTASGSVSLRFAFRDGQTSREQRLEAWLDPGQRPWTLVGLAEGTVGYNRLNNNLEALGNEHRTWLTDGRLALYAKGRILGKWLMTLAYDSDKKASDTRFAGTIDPNSYYTVYADRSERRYDAASVKKLYLKLERPQFYALFGDYQTGIDEPELARYVRAFTGGKAEYRSPRVSAIAFAASAPGTHRRDDIQGNGLTGPYALGARNILANSEQVSLVVRDRLRSDRIVSSQLLTRYVDYDIDYLAGTIVFKQPILSRDSDLNPQFIVAEYEVDGTAKDYLNAGGRVAWRTRDQKLQVAATALHDATDQGRTDLAGADIRYRPNATTEIRAEAAVSHGSAAAGAATPAGGTAKAWLIEAEHHGKRYDLLVYAREQEAGFGVGQLSAAENGTRKVGFDGRVKLLENLSLSASGWVEDYLDSAARRIAGKALLEYKGRDLSARAGFTFADDHLQDGSSDRSTLLELGVTKRLLRNKLELDAQTDIPIGGQEGSVDFPAQQRFTARYSLSKGVQLVGAYEIARGDQVNARTARIGFDIQPWAGAKIALTGNMQDIAEYGPRSFAAFGLSQSLALGKHWSLDATLDSNRTLGGIDPAKVLNPLQPVASGGFIGSGGITEDFTAVTAGATYRARLWSATARAEYRAGDEGDRYGLTAAALRQIGNGGALGAAFDWRVAKDRAGAETRTTSLQLSWANRPANGALSWLEKLDFREDSVTGAVLGQPDPIGAPFTIAGNARSRRVVNSLSINYTPHPGTEISVFWGARYSNTALGTDDVAGWSNLLGADVHFDLGKTLDVTLAATVREGAGFRSTSYAIGPSLGVKPFDNGWLSIGWNLVGFRDRDFEQDRYTHSGPYVTMRIKFDQLSLAGLGIGRR
ncbi:MAG TPA: hypothetical protein VFW19_13040 [Allosphingosinicella sp.]|nr:hypothetical protein [Allosphingosinicella sp.]